MACGGVYLHQFAPINVHGYFIMISTEVAKFSTLGKRYLEVHPHGDAEDTTNEVWVTSNDNDNDDEKVHWRRSEVYANKSVIIWSRGCGLEKKRFVYKCCNVDHDVNQLAWCYFHNLNSKQDRKKDEKSNDLCLCALESNTVDIFRANGTMNTVPLPVKVKKIWSLPSGFCVQRISNQDEESRSRKGIPTLFSLVHPLDDFCPAVFRYPESNKSFYFTDADQEIVFTSSELPLLVTYDTVLSTHSIWKVRKATIRDKPDPITVSETSADFQPPSFHLGNLSSRAHSRLSGSPCPPLAHGRYSHSPSPIATAAARSRQHSPSRAMSPLTLARMNSPAMNNHVAGLPTKTTSPHSVMLHDASFSSDVVFSNLVQPRPFGRLSSPLVYRLSCEESMSVSDDRQEFESMPPNLCLEHLWQEDDKSSGNEAKGKAENSFVSEDICEQLYLCLLITKLEVLRLIEFETNNVTSTFNFGSCFDVPAKHAGPLRSLKMMVVLHPNGELLLYSGIVQICALDSLVKIERLNLQESSSPALELLRISYDSLSHDVARNRWPNTEDSTCGHNQQITGLRDFNKNSFVMVLENKEMFKVVVPKITHNELVSNCLKVLKEMLDSKQAISIIAKYYVCINDSNSTGDCTSDNDDWDRFINVTLLLMGFPEKLRISLTQKEGGSPAPPEPKKAKKSASFCDNQDWECIKDCGLCPELDDLLKTKSVKQDIVESEKECLSLNSNMPLYEKIAKILHGWHLLYEDMKLDVLTLKHRKDLCGLLLFLASCLRLEQYCSYYALDFPDNATNRSRLYELSQDVFDANVTCRYNHFADQLKELQLENSSLAVPIRIEKYVLESICPDKTPSEFSSSHKNTQLIIKSLRCIHGFATNGITASPDSMISELQISDPTRFTKQDCAEKVLEILSCSGFSKSDLKRLPFGLALIFQEILHSYRHKASNYLPPSSTMLLGREDLAKKDDNTVYDLNKTQTSEGEDQQTKPIISDEEIFKFRFNCDLRIEEVKQLLDSSSPVAINIVQRPEVNDHDFAKEQEAKLLTLSKRTMALSVGRGMLTMGTCSPTVAETVSIPTLKMNGKTNQGQVITLLSQTDLPTDLLHWPSFHNGVAAGLKIASANSQIDSTWIVYNKLKYNEVNEELAGFIMALGLSGHLSVLPAHLIHDYLSKGHEFTSVALLLGIAASKCGTKDANTYKLLAVHVDALLPPTALEVNISHSAQVAAILGTGLLYLGTSERHLIKILLQEIGRPPGPEMDNAVNRESHSLAAGFALGMLMLGKGADSLYLSDLKIAEELHHYIFGGQQRELPVYIKEAFKSPSYLIKEDNAVNTDVTCPSAIIALAFIYLKTNNRVVSNWLCCPGTTATLETIKQNNLLLMLLARGLILWDETMPSTSWVESHLPEIFDAVHFETSKEVTNASDMEILRLSYCCVIAGSCMALGIKFAGSCNKAAFDTLLYYTKKFKTIVNSSIFDKGGKSIGEMCLDVTLLSLSLVMAGSGNLEVLRIARSLRKRSQPDITYGSHQAIHMAIGFLFLGGGRYTLATNNKAVAGLVCALYPKFPLNSGDIRYHLQALRHLYVLACEPRLVVPRDLETDSICYAPLLVKLKATSSYPPSTVKLLAPCFVPEFSLISEIQVLGPSERIIETISCLRVKRKAGYLSYSEDPKGHKNLMARTFTEQSEKLETIKSFSSSSDAVLFAEFFCSQNDTNSHIDAEFLSSVLFECVSNEKLEILQTYLSIEQIINDVTKGGCDNERLVQLKMVFEFYDFLFPKLKSLGLLEKPLINENYLLQSQLRIERALSWL
eukprot:gene20226-22202_t